MSVSVHRGALLHFLRDPGDGSDASAYEYFADGLLVIAGGRPEDGRSVDLTAR